MNPNPTPSRRDILKAAAVGVTGVVLSPFLSRCAEGPGAESGAENSTGGKKKILFFTRSQDFPHPVVTRTKPDELAFAEKIFKDLGEKADYEITVSKDGTVFNPGSIEQFDAFAFYTTGDLTKPPATPKSDQTPAMTPAGKIALLRAVADGKGLLGLHCASDTFHAPGYVASKDNPYLRPDQTNADPYILMVGGEFNGHASQQKATVRVASKTFPALTDLQDYETTEEWYSFYNLAPDLHVILVQDTATMPGRATEWQYQRDPYPETWARRHERGRVFYSSMGHREDVWTSPFFQKVVLAGLAWTSGRVRAEVPPNLAQACPALAATKRA